MRKTWLSLAAGLALVTATSVSAQGYLGGGIGMSRYDVDCTGVTTCDKTGTGGKLYGGWSFAKDWALELGYFDWGKATASEDLANLARWREQPMKSVGGTLSMSMKGSGVGLGVAYLFAPSGSDWTGVLRAGVARTKGEVSASMLFTDGSGGDLASASTRSTQPYIGLGFGYQLNKQWAITGEADFSRVKFEFDGESDRADVQMFSIGVRYRF